MHKIFKLCGSPPDEFWENSKLPHATVFKPQNSYESTLWERCKEFPETAVKLIANLLSIDPSMRGTASSALMSEVIPLKFGIHHTCILLQVNSYYGYLSC